MAFTTETKVRQEAGFQSNTNVASATVLQYQTRAYNYVLSAVAGRYDTTQFVAGSLFTGSQAESVLEQCELLLAAGWLINSEFQGQPRAEADGKNKIDEAKAMLAEIQSGKLRLLDTAGAEFTSGGKASEQGGAPEYTAPARETEEPTYSERKFTVDDMF